jgi:resolvase-like protein
VSKSPAAAACRPYRGRPDRCGRHLFVVQKVDRLTRALSDFAKLVDVFDRRGVSFVSITQQFNTTTSMGRLTLWMGGMPPLGLWVPKNPGTHYRGVG